MNNRETPSWSI